MGNDLACGGKLAVARRATRANRSPCQSPRNFLGKSFIKNKYPAACYALSRYSQTCRLIGANILHSERAAKAEDII